MYAYAYTFMNNVASSHTGKAVCGDKSGDCETGLPKIGASGVQINQILVIVFGALAALAVLMIVIAGLRLVTAQGDSNEVAKARKTIIYALAGLAVALTAQGIIAFVLGKV